MKRIHRIGLRVVLLALSSVVGLSLVELVVRQTGFVSGRQWGPVSEVVRQDFSSFSERLDLSKAYFYTFDRIVTDRISRLTVTYPDETRRTYEFEKPADAFRVVAVGDSNTELWSTPGYRNYTDFLRERLAARLETSVEVLPLGVSGYNTWQQRHYFSDHFSGLRGDVLLLQLSPNDIDVVVARPRTDEPFHLAGINGPLPAVVVNGLSGGSKSWPDYDVLSFACAQPDLSGAPFGAEVLWIVGHLWQRHVRKDPFGGLVAVEANDELDRATGWFRDHAERKGMTLVAVVFPRLAAGASQAESRLIVDVLRRHDILTLDLRAALTADVDPEDVRIDALHPNVEGHRLAADAVFEFLERHGALTKTSGR